MNIERPSAGIEALQAPKIKIIDRVDFPIVEKEIQGYKVLVIPKELRDAFDKEGYEAVRINSVEIAKSLPIYGGKTTEGGSLLPHQDHSPKDPRRFLALSKDSTEERGSTTYIIRPEVVRQALPQIINYFKANMKALREQFREVPNSQVSREELLSCFEIGGLERLVKKKIGEEANADLELFAYLGILGYLIRGESADKVVEKFLNDNEGKVLLEEWKNNGTLIFDNSRVFHGRHGGNINALQRNWLVAE